MGFARRTKLFLGLHDGALYNTADCMASRKKNKIPIVLTIAGYDPSSGAGVTADIKTIAAHGCYGVSCITALTVQSTRGVKRVEAISGKMITQTLEELAQDVKIAAVKIGMLGSVDAARAVASFLERKRPKIVVLDPILRSSSGAEMILRPAIAILKAELLAKATVITPNIDEAAALTGITISGLEQMRDAAERLHQMGGKAVVITGGHLRSPVDLVSHRSGAAIFLEGAKIRTRSTHGTGCAFSTSLACHLALGRKLDEAARAAKRFVESALRRAPNAGRGRGPVI
jgi:hydroxymethylpyrimidine/phosphomethylpyrimidine kinase